MKLTFTLSLIFISLSLFSPIGSSCGNGMRNNTSQKVLKPERLKVSHINPHLLETVTGNTIFLNNYTLWFLLRNGKREDIPELFDFCKKNKYNMISIMILDFADRMDSAGISVYGNFAFEHGTNGLPDPLKPIVTPGNNPEVPGEYDFWDHLDYIVDLASANGIYISLHPAWGDWFSGSYNGEQPGDPVIFNETNAYKYGQWLGKRYKDKENVIWMNGGDRSAVYESKTSQGIIEVRDYRPQYRAMAEGLADGVNGKDVRDGHADYSNILMSFHPRKWTVNSSEWFHNDSWLTFNTIQDTPYDQFVSVAHDYNLKPVKPTWLYEGRYEGRITAWGIRYQAYQTVFAGAFGHTYGGQEMYKFPANWREMVQLPGSLQMKHLYFIAREIWTDKQFLDRTPDQALIIGDNGETKGDGITIGDGDGGSAPTTKINGTSDLITAMRGGDGKWALVYTANGRDLTLDLARLFSGKLNACWFNPRNGKWWAEGKESEQMVPFLKNLETGKGSYLFEAPGTPGPDNDWVLVLK
jgi:hypothetical protein